MKKNPPGKFFMRLLLFALSFPGRCFRFVLGIGGNHSEPAPILLWPRIDSEEEAIEQFWRCHYFFPEHETTLWVAADLPPVPKTKPDHIGEVPACQKPPKFARSWAEMFTVLWRMMRQRGRIVRWRRLYKANRYLDAIFQPLFTATLDRHSDRLEGCKSLYFRKYLRHFRDDPSVQYQRFHEIVDALPKKDKCYIFGTGPSLELADKLDFSDGYTIICNAVVKDGELVRRLNPVFTVIGDPVCHYGYAQASSALRNDLKKRLTENPNLHFLFPDDYDEIVSREFPCFSNRTIAVPTSKEPQTDLNLDLMESFCLPRAGNALNLFLLPLASTLADKIYLLGFDGRAPDDQYFWSYSEKHSYDNLFPSMLKAYPAFFKKTDYVQYQKLTMGEETAALIEEGKRRGKTYTTMTPSFSPGLENLYRKKWFESDRTENEQIILSEWEHRFFAYRKNA